MAPIGCGVCELAVDPLGTESVGHPNGLPAKLIGMTRDCTSSGSAVKINSGLGRLIGNSESRVMQ